MARDAQIELFRALTAHTAELEIERDAASGSVREFFDRRIEAAQLLSDWVAKALDSGRIDFGLQTQSPFEPKDEPDQSAPPQADRPSVLRRICLRFRI
jgi:hypothetical protein